MAQQLQLQKEKTTLNEKILALTGELASTQRKSELKSLALYLGLLTTAVLGRVALQNVPSVEPILPLAVLAGLLFGAKEGFVFGASAYVASNFFVWGLQGPWTIFQALGGGLAGLFGGLHRGFGRPSGKALLALTVFSTLVFEVIMNVSGGLLGLGLFTGLLGLPMYFLTSLPFSLVHLVTNLGFAKFAEPLLDKGEDHETKLVSLTRAVNGKRITVRVLNTK